MKKTGAKEKDVKVVSKKVTKKKAAVTICCKPGQSAHR